MHAIRPLTAEDVPELTYLRRNFKRNARVCQNLFDFAQDLRRRRIVGYIDRNAVSSEKLQQVPAESRNKQTVGYDPQVRIREYVLCRFYKVSDLAIQEGLSAQQSDLLDMIKQLSKPQQIFPVLLHVPKQGLVIEIAVMVAPLAFQVAVP